MRSVVLDFDEWQHELLTAESVRTGRSVDDLVRVAVDARYSGAAGDRSHEDPGTPC